MKKFLIFLSIMLSLSIGYSNSSSSNAQDGTTVLLIATSASSSAPRTDAIIASINGHTLTVVFTENLGTVTIEVKDVYGVAIDLDLIGTPNGYQCYIPLAGHYTVVFKLSNGDEYSGEFDVTD